jgi:patatin-like phospholipase/acyl hydrolase
VVEAENQYDFNPEGKKAILSVDGGGMRGTIPIAMLAQLERMTGKTCQQMFDMVAGTSTGAVIAAGLGIGLTAGELLETIYKDRLPNAFRSQRFTMWVRYLFSGLRHFYRLEPFLEMLGPLAEGKRVRDLQRPIVFMTTKDVRTGNTYFVVSKGPGARAFGDWPVSGAVAASGAAPIFFPPVLGNLVDGGVGMHNNPCLGATVEAMEYIGEMEGFVDGNVIHISLGTGYIPHTFLERQAERFWLKDWVKYIIIENLDDAALQQVFSTNAIYGTRIDFRRYNPYLTRVSVAEQLGVPVEGRPDPSQLSLDSHEPEQVRLMEEIGRAYAQKIDWTQAGTMPWETVGGHPKPGIEAVSWAHTPYH